MSNSPYILEGNAENFTKIVLEQSARSAVLVDFWAAWCQPCQMLTPVLETLADAYKGKLVIVKVNSDEQQALASRYGVRSLPTLKLFRNGQVVAETMGVQPESQLRRMIDPHIVRDSDIAGAKALELYSRGQTQEALTALREISAADPENYRLQLALSEVLGEEGEVDEALAIVEGLPMDVASGQDATSLRAKLRLASMSQETGDPAALAAAIEANPRDSESRFRLASLNLKQGMYREALDQLLEILRRDRAYRDEAARKTMLEIFDMLPPDHPLVTEYRRKMFTALH
ncbi:MAG: thioredoxin [Chromatiales bacterium]|nr:thioredoxin [Chromatiales bacterium]